MRGSQPSELFIEMMTEKASLIESNPLEFREKLLGIRRKGGTIINNNNNIIIIISFFILFFFFFSFSLFLSLLSLLHSFYWSLLQLAIIVLMGQQTWQRCKESKRIDTILTLLTWLAKTLRLRKEGFIFSLFSFLLPSLPLLPRMARSLLSCPALAGILSLFFNCYFYIYLGLFIIFIYYYSFLCICVFILFILFIIWIYFVVFSVLN